MSKNTKWFIENYSLEGRWDKIRAKQAAQAEAGALIPTERHKGLSKDPTVAKYSVLNRWNELSTTGHEMKPWHANFRIESNPHASPIIDEKMFCSGCLKWQVRRKFAADQNARNIEDRKCVDCLQEELDEQLQLKINARCKVSDNIEKHIWGLKTLGLRHDQHKGKIGTIVEEDFDKRQIKIKFDADEEDDEPEWVPMCICEPLVSRKLDMMLDQLILLTSGENPAEWLMPHSRSGWVCCICHQLLPHYMFSGKQRKHRAAERKCDPCLSSVFRNNTPQNAQALIKQAEQSFANHDIRLAPKNEVQALMDAESKAKKTRGPVHPHTWPTPRGFTQSGPMYAQVVERNVSLRVNKGGRIGVSFTYFHTGWLVDNLGKDPKQDELQLWDIVYVVGGTPINGLSQAEQEVIFRENLKNGVRLRVRRPQTLTMPNKKGARPIPNDRAVRSIMDRKAAAAKKKIPQLSPGEEKFRKLEMLAKELVQPIKKEDYFDRGKWLMQDLADDWKGLAKTASLELLKKIEDYFDPEKMAIRLAKEEAARKKLPKWGYTVGPTRPPQGPSRPPPPQGPAGPPPPQGPARPPPPQGPARPPPSQGPMPPPQQGPPKPPQGPAKPPPAEPAKPPPSSGPAPSSQQPSTAPAPEPGPSGGPQRPPPQPSAKANPPLPAPGVDDDMDAKEDDAAMDQHERNEQEIIKETSTPTLPSSDEKEVKQNDAKPAPHPATTMPTTEPATPAPDPPTQLPSTASPAYIDPVPDHHARPDTSVPTQDPFDPSPDWKGEVPTSFDPQPGKYVVCRNSVCRTGQGLKSRLCGKFKVNTGIEVDIITNIDERVRGHVIRPKNCWISLCDTEHILLWVQPETSEDGDPPDAKRD